METEAAALSKEELLKELASTRNEVSNAATIC